MNTKLISFYCDIENKTYYSDCAKKLINACKMFNVSCDIEQIESSNNYMINCLRKPKFILNKLEHYKCPLIWMDADTEFRQPFNDFDNCDADLGFCSHTGNIEGIKASPVYFNYTQKCLSLVKDWVEICEDAIANNKFDLDHDALKHKVIPKYNGNIKIKILSENYNDYCDGKYIKNGNSHGFTSKNIAHRMMPQIYKNIPSLKQNEFKNA